MLAMLAFLQPCSDVYTNPASLTEQGQLLLGPYHSHSCSTCPVNMCKRIVLQQHMQSSKAAYSRVAYVGDGRCAQHAGIAYS
jgi:pyridoxal phosphate phosphatase PHOSPHO2